MEINTQLPPLHTQICTSWISKGLENTLEEKGEHTHGCTRVCVFLKNNMVFLHFTQLKEILHLKLFRANTTHREHEADIYIFLGAVN